MFFLIGHRGVGKTSLIKAFNEATINGVHHQWGCYTTTNETITNEIVNKAINKNTSIEVAIDLDDRISQGFDIFKIFCDEGESRFREIERKTLNAIIQEKKHSVVALGAGFELEKYNFPKDSKFIWIQRDSDRFGRIFLNRPSLEKDLNPLEEFKKRKKIRDKVFNKFCDLRLALEEGDFKNHEPIRILKELLQGVLIGSSRGYFTPSSDFELNFFLGNVELRTDFFDQEKILKNLGSSRNPENLGNSRNPENPENLENFRNLRNLENLKILKDPDAKPL